MDTNTRRYVRYRNAHGDERYQPALPTGERLWRRYGEPIWAKPGEQDAPRGIARPIFYRYAFEAIDASHRESGFERLAGGETDTRYVVWRNAYGEHRYQPRLPDGRAAFRGRYVPGIFWDHADADGYGWPALVTTRRRARRASLTGRILLRIERAQDTLWNRIKDDAFAEVFDDPQENPS